MSAAAAKRTVLTVVAVALLIVAPLAGAGRGNDKESPTVPTNVHVVSATTSQIDVAWGAAQDNVGVTGYDVDIAGRHTQVDDTSYMVSDLACGWSAELTVKALDSSGNTSAGVTITVSTAPCADRTPPTMPSGFRQLATTQDGVVLAWDPSADDTGVVGYEVLRAMMLVGSSSDPNVTVTGLTCGTTYELSVSAVDAAANRSLFGRAYATTSPCPTAAPPTPAPAPSTCPSGQFRAQYFGNTTLAGTPVKVVCETKVDYDWASASPDARMASDKFSVRWAGQFDLPAGDTTFTVTGDDGVRLWVDGTMVIDVWKDQYATPYTVKRSLAAGTHDIKLEYYENLGQANARLSWTTAAAVPAPTPAPAPSTCPSGQFRAQYFGNTTLAGTPVKVVCETKVDYDWASASPDARMASDKFSVRWAGQFDLPAGDTTFTVTGDDGVRLWVDGTMVIDVWKDQYATPYTVKRSLAAGTHDIKLEYYENLGQANARLSWTTAAAVPAPTPAPAPSTCPSGQFRAQYFGNTTLAGTPVKVVCETKVDYDWASASPDARMASDKFSVRWAGQFDLPAGDTTFTVTGDDGVRLWVDGTMVIDVWKDQYATPYTVKRSLAAGTHDIKLEYYENLGQANARLSWTTAAAVPAPTPAPAPADTTPPTEPQDLSIATANRLAVALTWDPSQDDRGVTGYGAYSDGVPVASPTQTATSVSNLMCGTSYLFEVNARDAAGNQSTNASVIGSTLACADAVPPSVPTNIVATSRTATSIALSWTTSTDNVGVAGYGLYWGGTRIGTSTTPVGIFAGLTCETSYTLAVDASDAAGNRSAQAVVMVSTTACPDASAPSAPLALAASNVTDSSLTLSWNASSDNVGVTGYDVYRDGAKVANVSSSSAAQTGLACGTSYSFNVVARDAAGNASSAASLNVSAAACTAPTWTSSIADGQSVQPGATWTAVVSPTPDSVEFWVTPVGGANNKLKTDTSAPYDVTLNNLAPGNYVLGVCSVQGTVRTCFADRKNVAITASGAATSPPSGSSAYFVADYANGTFGAPWTSLFSYMAPGYVSDLPTTSASGTPDGRVKVVQAPGGTGNAARFELRDSDPGWPAIPDVQKSEVRSATSYTFDKSALSVGDIRWFSTRVYLPYNSSEKFEWAHGGSQPYTDLMDLHTGSSTGVPAFTMGIGAWEAREGNANRSINFLVNGGSEGSTASFESVKLWQLTDSAGARVMSNHNRWIDLVWGMRFAPDSSGWLEVWVDGVNVYPRKNRPTMWVGDTGQYLKYGLYKRKDASFPETGRSVAYFGRTTVGTAKP